jgi:hypothetical protein
MSNGVFVEELGHEDDAFEKLSGGRGLVLQGGGGGGGPVSVSVVVSAVGHSSLLDSRAITAEYGAEYTETVIVEEVTGSEELLQDRGVWFDLDYAYRVSSKAVAVSPTEYAVAGAIALAFVFLIFSAVFRHRSPKSKDTHCRNKLLDTDKCILASKDLIRTGRVWAVHEELYGRLCAIVSGFKSESIEVDNEKEYQKWFARANDTTELFQKLLTEMSGYVESSRHSHDVEDEHFLTCFGSDVRGIFEVFLDQKKFLISACPDPEDRMQSALMHASESNSVRNAYAHSLFAYLFCVCTTVINVTDN